MAFPQTFFPAVDPMPESIAALKAGDFGKVMVLLGHKSLRYVLLYAQLSEAYYVTPKYISAEAETKQECRRLIDDGFEYVMDKDGFSLFRKLK